MTKQVHRKVKVVSRHGNKAQVVVVTVSNGSKHTRTYHVHKPNGARHYEPRHGGVKFYLDGNGNEPFIG